MTASHDRFSRRRDARRGRLPSSILLAGTLAISATQAATPAEPIRAEVAPAQAEGPEPPRNLERELASERLRCAELEAETGRLRRALNQCEATSTLAGDPTPASARPGAEAVASGASSAGSGTPAALTTAGLALAAGFALGMLAGHLLADWLQRRRHGGFRL
jgi:hypothetical protein